MYVIGRVEYLNLAVLIAVAAVQIHLKPTDRSDDALDSSHCCCDRRQRLSVPLFSERDR
jgi:hypothetical protein